MEPSARLSGHAKHPAGMQGTGGVSHLIANSLETLQLHDMVELPSGL